MAKSKRSSSPGSARRRPTIADEEQESRLAQKAADMRPDNGHGHLSEETALEWAKIGSLDPTGLGLLHKHLFHGFAKQAIWELHLLFEGQVVDTNGKTHHLEHRLTPELRDEAKEAFQILWGVICRKSFERSPRAAAQADPLFRRFIAKASGESAGAA